MVRGDHKWGDKSSARAVFIAFISRLRDLVSVKLWVLFGSEKTLRRHAAGYKYNPSDRIVGEQNNHSALELKLSFPCDFEATVCRRRLTLNVKFVIFLPLHNLILKIAMNVDSYR
jgi:hypothetical protein